MPLPAATDPSLTDLYPVRRPGVAGQLALAVRNVRDYRFFIRQLVKVSLQTEFKRSFIGLTWLLIIPLFSVATWILLNGAGVIDPGATDIPYPAYVLLSTSIWGFFVEMYKSASTVIQANGRMMIMTVFPHETLVVERVLVHLLRFSIPFVLNLIVLLAFGVKFTWLALLFPLTLLPLLLLALGIGLLVALLRIVAVDIANLFDEAMRVLMFLTPVVYTPKLRLGWLSAIVDVNPLTYLVSFSRDVLAGGTFFEPRSYLLVSGLSLLFFLLSLRVFRATQPRILERLINA